MQKSVTGLFVLIAIPMLGGCDSIKEAIATRVKQRVAQETRAVASAAVNAAALTDESKTGSSSERRTAPPFGIVRTPTAANVPQGPIVGSANGAMFEGKGIWFEPDFSGWRLHIADAPLSSPTGFVSGTNTQTIHLGLPKGEQPSSGKKYVKPMKYGDGFFQIANPGKSGTTSWNTDNAYYLEITKWEAKPFDTKGSPFQVAGKASGKVYVAHKATGSGFVDSGAAGEFKDVIVRYMGKPKFN